MGKLITCKKCGQIKNHHSFGLCSKCYYKQYNQKPETKERKRCWNYCKKHSMVYSKIEKIKHGDSKKRLYKIWVGIRRRCLNPKNTRFKYYGSRGVKIYSEWKDDYLTFKTWALANGYTDNLTIDRIDNDGDYCPENCRWITGAENAGRRWRD